MLFFSFFVNKATNNANFHAVLSKKASDNAALCMNQT
jgi:hypothetical protein